jgi:hypothetical protein
VKRLTTALVPLLLALAIAPGMAAAAGQPAPLSIRTAPAVSSLAVTFEGRRYLTDASGRVQIPRAPGVAIAAMLPRIRVDQRQLGPRTKVRFARWFTVGDESVAALDVFRRVGWNFVDTQGAPVATERVERVVLRASSGAVQVLHTRLDRPRWLYARRVSLIRGHTVLKDIIYYLQRVTVLGADVVNAGQQKFSPQDQQAVSFKLAFFTLTVRGEDALFGSAQGKHARLILPNGDVRPLTLTHGQTVVRALPRGEYKIMLDDGVYRMSTPLVLSRTQVAIVPVITSLDLIAVGGGLLILALGLVLVGRPYLARRAGARIAKRGRVLETHAEQP